MIDGHDIRDYRLVDLRRLVGGVVAEPFLFSASVRENITFGMPSATDDEVAEAAVVAGPVPTAARISWPCTRDVGGTDGALLRRVPRPVSERLHHRLVARFRGHSS